jgi:hypothetical protein
MSNYPPPQGYPSTAYPPPGYYPPQQQRPSSGCGGCLGKFLIVLGIIFLLLIVSCCGGIFYVTKYYFPSHTSLEPTEVQKISDEIISLRAAPLEPVAGGRYELPIGGKSIGQGVFYSDKNHKAVLFLVAIGDLFGSQFSDQILQGLESGQFQGQAGAKRGNNENHEELKDVKKTRHEHTIQGDKVVFEIIEGVGEKSNKRKVHVQGGFKGKTGPVLFVLDAEADALSLEQVEGIIDSME